MRKITIIIFSLFCIAIKAQDINKIKNQNVFFIYFDGSNLTKKGCGTIKNEKQCAYSFYSDNKKLYKFSFHYSKYPTFDDAHNDINAAMVYKLNKSFLRKNKDIIITAQFIQAIGEKKLISLVSGINKYIFLIDKSEIRNGKILVREVSIDYPHEM